MDPSFINTGCKIGCIDSVVVPNTHIIILEVVRMICHVSKMRETFSQIRVGWGVQILPEFRNEGSLFQCEKAFHTGWDPLENLLRGYPS